MRLSLFAHWYWRRMRLTVARDWRVIATPSWEELQMAHAAVNHARREVVSGGPDAIRCGDSRLRQDPLRGKADRHQTREMGKKRSAVGRSAALLHRFRRRSWFAAPYVPLVVGAVSARDRRYVGPASRLAPKRPGIAERRTS